MEAEVEKTKKEENKPGKVCVHHKHSFFSSTFRDVQTQNPTYGSVNVRYISLDSFMNKKNCFSGSTAVRFTKLKQKENSGRYFDENRNLS